MSERRHQGSSFETMPWWGVIVLWICHGFMQLPVLIRRSEYCRLKDLDYLVEDAHRAIRENYQLRRDLRAALGQSEFDAD